MTRKAWFLYFLLQCFPYYFTGITAWMLERMRLLQRPAFDDIRYSSIAEIMRLTPFNDWKGTGEIKGRRIRFSCIINATDEQRLILRRAIRNTYIKLKEYKDGRIKIRVDRYFKDLLIGESMDDDTKDYTDPLDILNLSTNDSDISWVLFDGNDKSAGGWDITKILHLLRKGYFDRYSGAYCEMRRRPYGFLKPVIDPDTALAFKDAIRIDDGFTEDLVCGRKKVTDF
ncbi:MAG: hypothetical protein JXQ30_16775 [Spirochaetes bacterium]|nr:hypothetical protein [Spirochaetota bacterium]